MSRPAELIVDDLRERDILPDAERIARAHGCTIWEMLSDSHERAPSWARHALWAKLYDLGFWSYPRLGKLFGRAHETIILGVRAHKARQPKCPELILPTGSP